MDHGAALAKGDCVQSTPSQRDTKVAFLVFLFFFQSMNFDAELQQARWQCNRLAGFFPAATAMLHSCGSGRRICTSGCSELAT
jgi:hypothetical protein